MPTRSYLLFFLVTYFCCTCLSYGQEVTVITPGSGLAGISARSGLFLDESAQISAKDIASGKCDAKFKYDYKDIINFGITHGASWAIFKLTNTGTDKVFLSVNNPIADSITLYALKNGNAIQIGSGGLSLPVSSRQISTENYMFDLAAGTDTSTYLVRFKSSRVHMYALRAGYLPAHVGAINQSSLWNAIYIGFVLLMALYHIFLYAAINNTPYIYYVGYVVSFGLFNAYINGSAFLYLWPNHPDLNQYDNILGCAAGFFSTMFMSTSLDLHKNAPGFEKATRIIALLYVSDVLVALLGYSFPAFIIVRNVTPLWLIVSVAATITVLRSGYKPARFFLAATLVAVSGVVVFMCNSFNVIEYNFVMAHSMQLTAMLEALILSFALADRFNTYRLEKEILMRTHNEMLELKVAERTDALKKQQLETEQLLLNILPEEVATELKENGVARSRNYEAVTVLFTDFKDFTSIVEKISPEQLIADLNFCFSAFDKIIEKYGIEKIKTIGDSYMCAGGFGVKDPDNALKVVNAGLEIRDFIDRRNKLERASGGHILEVRIGIHTGPVIAGIIGIKKFAYDIWGDTVNIASRMETAADTGKVNISGVTFRLVKDDFVCTHRGKIPAKNKGDIDMYYAERK